MPRLFWIRTFDKIDNETLQTVFVEPSQKLSMIGEQIKFCRVCKRWVPLADYNDCCQLGYHEYSAEIKLEDIEVDPRVGACLAKELEIKEIEKRMPHFPMDRVEEEMNEDAIIDELKKPVLGRAQEH